MHHSFIHSFTDKTEETPIIEHTRSKVKQTSKSVRFLLKKIAPSLYYNQQKVLLLKFKRVNVTVEVDSRWGKKLRNCISHPSP